MDFPVQVFTKATAFCLIVLFSLIFALMRKNRKQFSFSLIIYFEHTFSCSGSGSGFLFLLGGEGVIAPFHLNNAVELAELQCVICSLEDVDHIKPGKVSSFT